MMLKTPKFLLKIRDFFNGIHIPVLGISLWKMFEIYGQGVFKNQIGKNAASISWSFFLSLFPFVLFLLSILPYMPHYDKLQSYIFADLMYRAFPESMHADVTNYIQHSIIPKMKNFSSLTIILSLVFATNGTYSLIEGFNSFSDQKRGAIKGYLLAFGITVGFIAIIIFTLFGIYYVEVVLKLFTPPSNITWFVDNLSKIIGFISFPFFYLSLLTIFYRIGTVKITRFGQALPGAILTTALFVATTYFFAIYVRNFAKYNVLYGSIGSILLVMVWVNLNVVLLLLGNELNLAIRTLRIEKLLADELAKKTETFPPLSPDLAQFPENREHTIVLEKIPKNR